MLKLVFLFFLSGTNPSCAGEGESSIIFKERPTPIYSKISASEKIGAIVFESELSNQPSKKYDVALIHGEMPDANLKLEIWVKQKFFLFSQYEKYEPVALRRFHSGRFWAKFKLKALTDQPLKIAAINSGVKFDHVFAVYEAEIFIESQLKEDREAYSERPEQPVQVSSFPMPGIIVRGQWGASPPTQPYTPHTPRMLTLHHTAGRYPLNPEESFDEVQFIQDYHQNARGWIDIGYHFLIDPYGNIFEGRPVNVVGAHAKWKNTNNAGISVMGNYHPPESDTPTVKTFDAIVNLGRYVSETYEIRVSSFFGHRDLNATDCPGDGLYQMIPELKKEIFFPDIPPAAQVVPANLENIKKLFFSRD
ncbi:MAG: N-acetylmuramoyl-L-alanine amidase [Elusimicrobia bacterium]|nr:N-acetylmuramoyl-L-alanine amidase [Elusimicrobiota bacterium]